MIQRVTHAFVLVTDQDVAHDFYVNTLGFTPKMDMVLDQYNGMRWLSVSPPGQDDFELVLDKVRPWQGPDNEKQMTELLAAGSMPTVIFGVEDCRATYDELVAKGVDFYDEPTEHFYGIDAGFRDPFGNPFRMTQAKAV
jgi:catechol 2,3-dioxygenase-like lactoylglutathione lyase family enzyme